jgi:hypothetical protein
MTLDIRPEYLDTDTDAWFFGPDGPPQVIGLSTNTVHEVLMISGNLDVTPHLDDAGYMDAERLLTGIENELRRVSWGSYRRMLVDLRGVTEWAVKYGRRVEWV